MLAGLFAGLLAVVVLSVAALAIFIPPTPSPAPELEIVPESELDRRWGTFLSEREWGTPREAVGSNGWGLSWRGAIDTEYRYSSDAIGGMTDRNNEFSLGWAFWDRDADHVTERFFGVGNPQGTAGEAIVDDRVFRENTPRHAYQRLTYRYPIDSEHFEIELEAARFDSERMALVATVTNVSSTEREIDVVFKAWLRPGGAVTSVADGLLMRGETSVVAVVGQTPSEWQITADKAALDENLRSSDLVGDQAGHIGALAYRLDIPAQGQSVIRLGVAEVTPPSPATGDRELAEAQAVELAKDMLTRGDVIVGARADEADGLFSGQVTEHEELYRQALMALLWNESYYRWDGVSGINPAWAGRIAASDVLIMPDKWEFPWIASWDSAFHAVTAALADPQLAQNQIRFLFSDRWQQPDGAIPCAEWVMDLECPPVFAWAAWKVYEISHDRAFLEDVYPGLQRSYDYWWQRNHVGDSLFTGGFLGMDNLPRGGTNLPQADATAWMALFARDMARIASELRDPQTSERYWVDRGQIQESINTHLWDERTSFYYDLNTQRRFVRFKSYSGLIPLIAGVVPPERLPPLLAALRDESQFMSQAGIRSMAANSPTYLPGEAGQGVNSNWRGPVWVPINYMLVEALADIDPRLAADIRNRVVDNVERDWHATSRFHEFFDGETGLGLGADQQGWTMLVANMIREGWPATAAP